MPRAGPEMKWSDTADNVLISATWNILQKDWKLTDLEMKDLETASLTFKCYL